MPLETDNKPTNSVPAKAALGLLPEPERHAGSFITSAVVNTLLALLAIYIGATAKHAIDTHRYEQTNLIFPTDQPKPEIKKPPPVKLPDLPKPHEAKLDTPKINIPKPEPEVKPLQMEAKVVTPVMKTARPSVVMSPQPKAALSAAMPAVTPQARPSTAQVHLGMTNGVTPNPNANRPATIAAVGNPYGGMQGPSALPRGVVGSTGIGNSTHSGSNAGVAGKVASAGIPGSTGTAANGHNTGRVASAGIPTTTAAMPQHQQTAAVASTNIEVLSKPPVQYTSEARQLRVQGDVILHVTFTADGHVVVHNVMHSLGHGLDEEARRVAQQIRFRPATRNGQPVDVTTNITITFQMT